MGDLNQMPVYRQQLLHLAAGNDKRIRFIPFISSQSLLMGLIQRARLFVFPSTNEAMSMMLLEVAALGVFLFCAATSPRIAWSLERWTRYFRSGDVERSCTHQLDWAMEPFRGQNESAR